MLSAAISEEEWQELGWLSIVDWQVARKLGDSSRARRSRRLLRRYDLDEKWLWELQREEATRGG